MYEIYKYILLEISLRKTEERKLWIFERKISRKTFRPVNDEGEGEGECRKGKNSELGRLLQKQKKY